MTSLTTIDFPTLAKAEYETQLAELQFSLMRYQQYVYNEGKRVVIAVEGTDASGKGGMIKRLTHLMDPRGVRVYPIGAPNEIEQKQHYLQRFWSRLPHEGEIVVFDRTWYGRVLVEAIEHGLSADKVASAYQDIEAFEQQLLNEGVLLIKLFLHISYDEQEQRFLDRLEDPVKRWKLTKADLITREFWDEYQLAYQRMLGSEAACQTPWKVVAANDKRFARVEAIRYIEESLHNQFGSAVCKQPDSQFQQQARQALRKG